ncbi:MAG TPA: thioredoxin family protein [Anaerolineae bacterium]|nr:thioredoxin family protein [Anaerolineae bacterium]
MILNDEQRREVSELLEGNLEQSVKIVYFTQQKPSIELPVEVGVSPCEYCEETEELLKEISDLSDKLAIEIYDYIKDKDKVEQYEISDVPATILLGDKDYGIRYYGIPSGYEFSALLETMINVSKRQSKLTDSTKEVLASIEKPVHMKVFVTPT